ncbi:MAG: metal ABC transporter substrate-binding protein [Phycisphaerae bacterium]|jgi:zinc transport system substrate-binding protein|nr:metal ABC transporter substrate-binding protein [Phycisphaerae bacterium]
MNMHKHACILLAVTILGCSNTETPQQRAIPEVYTTFYPTTYFAQRIAGDLVKIICPLPADKDPITWMPNTATIAAYQQADLILVNGADFDRWVDKVSLPPSKLIDTACPLAGTFVGFDTSITHSHGPGGQHDHAGIDGHTWLDPHNAKIQAAEVHKALVRLLPSRIDKLRANHTALAEDLDAIDASLATLSEKLKDQGLLAAHPAYNYLVRRYEWNLTNLDLDPEVTPSNELIADIRKQVEQIRPRPQIILWEQQPVDTVSEQLKKDLGLVSVVFSPCEHRPNQPHDYLSVMRANVSRLQAALSTE